MKLSKYEIDSICDEIELQWIYHIMTRAIFSTKFPRQQEYESPSFYKMFGINFHVRLPKEMSDQFKRGSKGIAVWLNQNYVIRLYGILDDNKIIKDYRIKSNREIFQLIRILRNNIGAHSTGRKVHDQKELNEATTLINKLFGRSISIEQVSSYTLSVDSVLFPMKEQVIKTIREGFK